METYEYLDRIDLLLNIAILLSFNIGIALTFWLIKKVNRLEVLLKWKQFEQPKEIEIKKKRGRPRKEK